MTQHSFAQCYALLAILVPLAKVCLEDKLKALQQLMNMGPNAVWKFSGAAICPHTLSQPSIQPSAEPCQRQAELKVQNNLWVWAVECMCMTARCLDARLHPQMLITEQKVSEMCALGPK